MGDGEAVWEEKELGLAGTPEKSLQELGIHDPNGALRYSIRSHS